MSQAWGGPATQRPGLPASRLSWSDMARCDDTASNHNMSMKALKWLQLLDMFDCHIANKKRIAHGKHEIVQWHDQHAGAEKRKMSSQLRVQSILHVYKSTGNYEAVSIHQCGTILWTVWIIENILEVFNLHLDVDLHQNTHGDIQPRRFLRSIPTFWKINCAKFEMSYLNSISTGHRVFTASLNIHMCKWHLNLVPMHPRVMTQITEQ